MKANLTTAGWLMLLALMTLSLQPSTIRAQGTAFTYQGRLNANGSPAAGHYDFRFRLAADPSANTILATMLTKDVSVTNGLFTACVDFGAEYFNGSNCWLEVDVKTNGTANYTALAPLQAMMATPYATFANTASNLAGMLPAAQLSGVIPAGQLSGSVANSQLAHSTISVNPGTGLSGGGAVALGSATTLNNAGVLSVTGNADITASTANGAVKLGDTAASANTPGTMVKRDASGNFSAGTITANLSGNATTVGGLGAANFWQLGGNNVASGQFLGSGNNQPLELWADGQRALRLEPNDGGLPNVIGGSSVNFVASGVVGATIGGGGASNLSGFVYINSVAGDFGTVAGGLSNAACSYGATISGGALNIAINDYATVAGGFANTAGAYMATVGGGFENLATVDYAAVGGGSENVAGGRMATVGGGLTNVVSGDYAAAGGGEYNRASGQAATIGGGATNSASGYAAAVCGGAGNFASGYIATVSGGSYNRATNGYGEVGGGYANTAGGYVTAVGGGYYNSAMGDFATVGGGDECDANGTNATVAGGYGNSASGYYAAVGGGSENWAYGAGAVVAGGGYDGNVISANIASGPGSAVLGGTDNTASGSRSTVGGGHQNAAENWYATVPGGAWNVASGQGSFAAGRAAKATDDGSFVWSDDIYSDLNSSGVNSVTMRAAGGFFFYSGSAGSGVTLASGSGSWTSLSDRNAKENFTPVDPGSVLQKVAALPMTTWNYKSQEASVRHIGPMAQDFKAAFAVGESDKGITTIDAEGVALAAIQGLNQKLEETRAENTELKARLERLERLLDARNGGKP